MRATKDVIRNLVQEAPFICGCDEPERVSFSFLTMYDATKNTKTPYDITPQDVLIPNNRFKFFDLTNEHWRAKDLLAARKVMALLNLCMWSNWFRKGKVGKVEHDTAIARLMTDAEIENAEIDAILPAAQAAVMQFWLAG
jgi:hypothetical protein